MRVKKLINQEEFSHWSKIELDSDVIAVHSGYARYRKPLRQAGIHLYEMQREPGFVIQSLPKGRKNQTARP